MLEKKITYLEGLRGLAALCVVVSHFVQVFYPGIYSGSATTSHTKINLELFIAKNPINSIVNANWAVCIFFVLSGFVLSYKFFLHHDKKIVISSAERRYLRLSIPVFISLICAFIMMQLNLYYYKDVTAITYSTMKNHYSGQFGMTDIIKQSFYSLFFRENIETYNSALWTIHYEFLGSFLIFSFLFIFGNVNERYVFYIILSVFFRDSYFLAFILGMILCDVYCNNINFDLLKQNKLLKILMLVVTIFFGSYPYVSTKETIYNYINMDMNNFQFFHIIAAFLLIYYILNSETLKRILMKEPILFLGKISFSLYLIHFPIIFSLSCFLFKILYNVIPIYHIVIILDVLLSMLVILPLSYVMYIVVDCNSIKLSKLMEDKLKKLIGYKKINLTYEAK